ncbi:MAG: SurA N-terminal domain-containing protein [Rhizobiales bacterium]|nr:SurA N-terminal domain-containing protein [Hyphomicrobiales bacterium]
MMDSMRNAAKSWVAKVLLGLLALSFGVWGIADVFRGFRAGSLATVGGQEISADQFTRAFNRALQNLSNQTGQALSPDEARKLGVDREVLNGLIRDAALDNQGKGLKLAISEEQILGEVRANPAYQDSQGKFDPRLFNRILEQNGVSWPLFAALQRQDHLRNAITQSVSGGGTASPTLTEAFYRYRNEQRDARYFIVKTQDSEVAEPTEAEIKAEYDNHPATYTAPEYRSFAIMRVGTADVMARVNLSDEELKAGYQKYKADYYSPEKRTFLQISFASVEEAQKAKDRIAAGTDFLAIAKERGITEKDATFSDKTKSDLLDPVIVEAAFKLPEGAVSDPIKGGLATVLVKIVKVAPEHQGSLDEVKANLSNRLKQEKAKDEIDTVYGMVEDGRGAGNSFEDIAKKAAIPFQLLGPSDAEGRGKDGKDLGLPQAAELVKAVFASDVRIDNAPLQTEDGYIWYDVREVVPSAVKPLAAVHDQAKANLMALRVKALALDKAKKLVERAAGGASFDSLAQETGATIKTALGLKRSDATAEFDAGAVDALFSVRPNGFAAALEANGKGARVIQSQPVLLPPYDPKSGEAKAIAKSLEQSAANDLNRAYAAALEAETGVSVNETLWRQIAGTKTP